MRYTLFFFFLLGFLSSHAQNSELTGIQLYRVGDQVVRANTDGTKPETFPYNSVKVRDFSGLVQVTIDGSYKYYAAGLFLNSSGTAYSSVSSQAAVNAFLSAIPVASGGGGGGSVSKPTTTATTAYTSVTTSGTISSGALMISIRNTGTASGTVAGTTLTAGSAITYPVLVSNTYPAISYDASGTTFLIQTIR